MLGRTAISVGRGLLLVAALVAAQVEVPEASAFRRRGLGDVAVLGDFLYFEGGEVSQWVDGQEDTRISRETNISLSISLKQSWTNDSVSFTEIGRNDKPLVKDNSLWTDVEGNQLFQWDGQGPWGRTDGAQDPQLWSFKPDNKGDGSWSTVQPANPSVYNSLIRGAMGASTVCGRKAYTIGGFANQRTDSDSAPDSSVPVPGMVTLDMEKREWMNRSIADLASPYGSYSRGKAACMADFGGSDYVITTGGLSTGPTTVDSGGEGISLGNVTLWDEKKQRWLWQETTGDTPPVRWDHCMVGAASTNGTYEVFIYGGRNNIEGDMGDLWVLTIPGFHWIRALVTSPKRYMHTCAVIGKRQMLSSGGMSKEGWESEDPWTYGLGVFDMSTFEWSVGFDADAEDYASPKVVRDWYADGGMDNITWNNDEVKAIFAVAASPSPSYTSGSGRDEVSENDSSPPTGAIAGGVVGGVAVLALIGTAIFFLKRRKRNRSSVKLTTGELPQNHMHQEHPLSELSSAGHSSQPPQEYYGGHNQYGQNKWELPAEPVGPVEAVELPVTNYALMPSELDGVEGSKYHGGLRKGP